MVLSPIKQFEHLVLDQCLTNYALVTPLPNQNLQGLRTTFSGPTHHFFLRF